MAFTTDRRALAPIGLVAIAVALLSTTTDRLTAQGPSLVDPDLAVRTIASGLNQPTSMAFLGSDDMLVLEKASGKVQRVSGGGVVATALDLAVNSASERGLLGIALHPNFPANPGVYLFWTESTTGADSTQLPETPLLGNRVDRFVWNGSTLTMDHNIIRLRAFQNDATNGVQRGNHDGGVIRFGPDGKLYIYMGDNGRRGQMQNLPDGPGCTALPCPAIPAGNMPDDQFGGPEPDNAHLTGVILRLNDDGTTPEDNPFVRAGELRGGEAGHNLQKVFAYGIRNGFGMAFDPETGNLWEAQNGDDTFTELNQVERGANLGWVQVMGPLSRLAQFKQIETNPPFTGLQQVRWSPSNIADTQEEAQARLFTVFEGGDRFRAHPDGAHEVPARDVAGRAKADFRLEEDGILEFKLEAQTPLQDVTQAHIHLGARGQNGPIVAFLFGFDPAGRDFAEGETIGAGEIDDDDVIERPGFDGTVATLAERLRQGRAYVNIHTITFPGGEIRDQVVVKDAKAVSRYSDPEFAWKFEVAPAAVGFLKGEALGDKYEGNLFTGAARVTLLGGQLFRFELSGNRRRVRVSDERLRDFVADNVAKFDITESESLLFGTNFGIVTDIHTGPNGNLFLVSLTNGVVYEIFKP